MMPKYFLVFVVLIFTFVSVLAHLYKMALTEDEHPCIYRTTFGYYNGGVLPVKVNDFKLSTGKVKRVTETLEKNRDSPSAGEMALPALYCLISLLFLLSACFWTYLIYKRHYPAYQIHHVMCIVVYLKAILLAFQGINYHLLQSKGERVTPWVVLYYLMHLLTEAVLFVTIVLVGTGWNFLRRIHSARVKKMIVIFTPLQVAAKAAKIIMDESEEVAAQLNSWADVFLGVDLLCCCATLLPVIWSIRHLKDTSSPGWNAAIIHQKLTLFRYFYVMIICYIYFTHIIVYLLKTTMTFQYFWVSEMLRELVTYVFFAITGYMFGPTAAHI